MSNFVEQVKEILCDFCGPEDFDTCLCGNKPEFCTREITALEIVKLAKMIQVKLDRRDTVDNFKISPNDVIGRK